MPGAGSGVGVPIPAGPVPVSAVVNPYPWPLLPLDTFRQLIGLNPWHFWQLANSDDAPVSADCSDLLYKYSWQEADQIGRADMIEALLSAEAKLRDYLKFPVAPQYLDVEQAYPRYFSAPAWRASHGDANGRWTSVQLPDGQVQAVGVETLTFLANSAVALADDDGDGLNENFTVTIATTETDPDKIAIYFTSGDRIDADDVGDKWRIQPVRVSISGGTATIRGKTWLLVKPILYEGFNPSTSGIDPTAAASFITTVAVYVRETNGDGAATTTAQGLFTWETPPYPDWAFCCGDDVSYSSSDTDPASIATVIARVGIRDSKLGLVAPGTVAYDTANSVWKGITWGTCRPPDRVKIRYLAGYPLEGASGAKQMAKKMQVLTTRMALAEMGRPICACAGANREVYRWQQDLARVARDEELFNLSQDDLNNPFGSRRGHVYAWREVRNLRLARGVSAL